MDTTIDILIDDIVLLSGERSFITITGNKITQVGGNKPENAQKTINGHGMLAMPPFYNTHTHSAMTVLRGFGDDKYLMDWLNNYIWPTEKYLTAEDVYVGAKLAFYEYIRTGTVFFNDMYWYLPETFKALKETGLRAAVSSVVISQKMDYDSKRLAQRNLEIFKSYDFNNKVQFWIAPHAAYSVSKDDLSWCTEFAQENNIGIHTHLSETNVEVQQVLKEHDKRPAIYLAELGLFDQKAITAHNIWLNDEEFELLAAKGVNLAHCPVSNMKLACGADKSNAFNYLKAKKAGLNVTLATDGPSSNNNLDMFEEMKIAALLAKHFSNDPTTMPASEILQIATENGAKAFGFDAGKLEPGKLADLILVRLDEPQMQPTHDLVSNAAYAANGLLVDTTICDGQILMQNSKIDGMEEVIEQAKSAATRLISKVQNLK